ncbi:HU family DNA-binding protein [Candidatus Sumerlaeota bacterium]|nr:HU family DNA-binding protein [Candidatus Sumerlaeota bacterium]
MTRAELIDIVAEKNPGLTKAQVAEVYDAIFDTITRALKDDEKHRFLVNGFGTFELKHRAARKGINPATREVIDIAASTTVGFKPAPALKDALGK